MKVFLLAGQSNMQGFGPVADYPVLSDDRIFNLATGNAEPAIEPLHSWHEHQMPDGIGLGLAMPFALEVLKAFPDIQIGFIPSASGGTYLDTWQPGAENFERAIALCERAKQNIPDWEVAGILWHQGEADSVKEEDALSYGSRFKSTINDFRERLDCKDAPIVAGEQCRTPEGVSDYRKWRSIVTEQTRDMVRELGNAAFVSSEGLVGHDGNLHLDTPSIRKFGLRYAAAYLDLVN